ncbi:hypothetical protein GGX14DRAFT_593053 [Mycena pura]|uniref:Uncharacterized protein n=1 Tax=Mycena pura TaxID=153505 RepID=A0AAD6URU5_9AGAR|nr:hypothetical protein GGX14DRAFT_593053 [Mycena pura]
MAAKWTDDQVKRLIALIAQKENYKKKRNAQWDIKRRASRQAIRASFSSSASSRAASFTATRGWWARSSLARAAACPGRGEMTRARPSAARRMPAPAPGSSRLFSPTHYVGNSPKPMSAAATPGFEWAIGWNGSGSNTAVWSDCSPTVGLTVNSSHSAATAALFTPTAAATAVYIKLAHVRHNSIKDVKAGSFTSNETNNLAEAEYDASGVVNILSAAAQPQMHICGTANYPRHTYIKIAVSKASYLLEPEWKVPPTQPQWEVTLPTCTTHFGMVLSYYVIGGAAAKAGMEPFCGSAMQ